MGKTKLDDETHIFKIGITVRFLRCSDIKILFFRALVTIEPGRSLLQFVTTNCSKLPLLVSSLYVGKKMIKRSFLTESKEQN